MGIGQAGHLADAQGGAVGMRHAHTAADRHQRGKAAGRHQCRFPGAVAAHRHAGQVGICAIATEFGTGGIERRQRHADIGPGPFLAFGHLRQHHDGREIGGMAAQVRAEPGLGLLDAIAAALARTVQEQHHRRTGRVATCGYEDLVEVGPALGFQLALDETTVGTGGCHGTGRQQAAQ